jgi:uncharacterized Zn finger protein
MGKRKQSAMEDLAWDDLEEWAGSRVVSRGKSSLNAVSDLRQTPDGQLVAWVQGTYRYATVAGMDEKAALSSRCTCPYFYGPCKHAVAVILAYLEAVRKKERIPAASANDERLRKLSEERFSNPSGNWEDEWDDEEGDLGEDGFQLGRTRIGSRYRRSANDRSQDLKKYLSGMTNNALGEFVLELAQRHPEVQQAISDRALLERGSAGKIVASTRREIEELSRQPAWTNHWSGEGDIPDYSRVRERLEALLEAGHTDQVIDLGRYLLERGKVQIDQSHDEGETGCEIGSCMEVVFRALPKSSLSNVDQILWMIDAQLEDDYGILDSVGDCLRRGGYGRLDWSHVADRLGDRLAKMSVPAEGKEERSFSSSYKRQAMMGWAIRALEQAGRKSEVIPLLEREAPITGCYEQLVDRLISARRRKEARNWAKQGYEETIGESPGIAWHLEGKLMDLAEREKNRPLAAAYRALEFFEHSELSKYTALEKAAKRAKVWPKVRSAVHHYLETGNRPDTGGRTPSAKARAKGSSSKPVFWPLPPTELELPPKEGGADRFPDTETLLDIAIKEKRSEDALKWFERPKQQRYGGRRNHDKVATAVQETHPDVALELWKELAEVQIAQVQPTAYQVAGQYLKKMQSVYRLTKRLPEWEDYLSELRDTNKRRPRLIEVLDRLEGKRKRILEGK